MIIFVSADYGSAGAGSRSISAFVGNYRYSRSTNDLFGGHSCTLAFAFGRLRAPMHG
jgi:hypothetical protein